MIRVENKCTNCANCRTCKTAMKSRVVIWKHCNKFKPSLSALDKAKAEWDRERERAKYRRYV